MKTNLLLTSVLGLVLASACGVDSIPSDNMDGEDDGTDDGGDDNAAGPDAGVVELDNRVKDGLQVLYRFDGVAGDTIIKDVSEVGTPYDLTIADPASVVWEPGGGLTFTAPTVAQNLEPLTKVIEACKQSQEITVEAWLKNATAESGGRVITSSIDQDNRNFALKQSNTEWEFRLRTSENNLDGTNPADLPAVNGMATTNIQHVIWTRDTQGTSAKFAFDGGLLLAGSTIDGNFTNWDLTYGLALANEPTLNRPWLGTLYLVAVYCTEFDQSMVNQNYAEAY